MVTLFDGLQTAANALKATGQALAVSEMNLTNEGVTGYARQNVSFTADAFNPTLGFSGGVQMQVQSARSQYAEQGVWSQNSQKGYFESFTQQASGVAQVLGLNDVSGSTGIPGTLAALYQSFSQLQQGATSSVNQENVLQSARGLALQISQTAEYLQGSAASAQSQIQTTVEQVNQLVSTVHQWNTQIKSGATANPLAEAGIYSSLETLSGLVPITAQKQADGTLTILMNGQTPLASGVETYKLSTSFVPPDGSAPFPDASASLHILTSQGQDVTDSITGGQLGGLLNYTNHFLPSLLGDANQQGDLNTLATSLADSVNGALGGSTPIFQYDQSNSGNAARSLTVTAGLKASDLSASLGANPGAAQTLAQIASGTNATNQIDGASYTDFLTGLSGRTNTVLNNQQQGVDLHTQLLNQAQTVRSRIQGSSLEQDAVELLQYQRSFQAAAKMVSVIDEMTQTAINMVS
ncbi:MAG: flagellar hook-associated protein FlgK [Acidobacteriota bacterium]